jgi:hypothetical protein
MSKRRRNARSLKVRKVTVARRGGRHKDSSSKSKTSHSRD